ncbi:MAG TPA: hypothetical protein VG253_11305, partial [Streptosporangiaceae bacterium]|nr:hypothetical protein [Streptosporangiaceae bacterium]
DNLYEDFMVGVELDGRAAHPTADRWRDIHRDNASASAGIITLRYNWADVTMHPCTVASQVAEVLMSRGFSGKPRPCNPACQIVHLAPRDEGRHRQAGPRIAVL